MKRKYKYNFDFFKSINNEEKSYILGLLFADGNNFVSKERCKISLVLHIHDLEHLKKVNYILESNRPLQISRNTCVLHLSGKNISDDLSNLGCVPRKSLVLEFPTLPKDLIPHFIRGYFDGDGCVSYGKSYKSVTILGTKDFLEGISSNLEDIKSTISIQKNSKIYNLRISSKTGIESFSNYIYKDASIFLKRKFSKFLEIKNN